MRQVANTLYITTQGAYLTRDHQTLRVKIEGKVRLTVPIHHLDGVICFGRVMVSPYVFSTASEHGLSLTFLSQHGRFQARVVPPTSGNVLLRREQYRLADNPSACLRLATPMIAGKIQNGRGLLLRAARETEDPAKGKQLRDAAAHLAAMLEQLPNAEGLNAARGIEGDAAKVYFGAFNAMIRQQEGDFVMDGRSRRPPRDPVNALLSFLYALVRHDCESALEGVGLDPAVGFLHVDRPGRPSLALDLMEEFRSLVADRVALSLINRRQVKPSGFKSDAGGAVLLDEATRRTLLSAFQERKREEVQHPLLKETVPIGFLPHVQARLLARTIRGEITGYPALVLR